MKRIKTVIVYAAILIFICFTQSGTTFVNAAKQQDTDPVVMVHGLFGWGNNELAGINYWGGDISIKNLLEQEGYTIYTPSLSPVSSNWDRACELYAYLVGGTVDYGQAHSQKYGHARFGRTYSGVYKELGTPKENEGIHKVHLIGHSMGGETIRVLAQLLEQGDQAEINETTDTTSALFMGGHSWIDSITTIATPHDGSQYAESKMSSEPYFHDMITFLSSFTGSNINITNLDFQLDQWGLKQEAGESCKDYIDRVLQSKLWEKTTDISLWDLSLEGAKELNSWVRAQDDIYYNSISCCDTHESSILGTQIPNDTMDLIMRRSSHIIGSYINTQPDHVIVDKEWWPNDGLVCIRSAMGPHEGSTDVIYNFDGTFVKGAWNYLGNIDHVDHIEVIMPKHLKNKQSIRDGYRTLIKMLGSLQ